MVGRAIGDARTEVLARIAAIPREPAPEPTRDYRVSGERSADDVVALFCARAAAYRAEVVRVDASTVGAAIERILAAHGAHRVGIAPGLRTEWRPAGCELIDESALDVAGLDSLDGAITGCTVAVAETGTIMLSAGTDEGRRALTLVPDLHVCVVAREQIVELLPEGIRLVGPLVRGEGRPLTLISGPSATSDIELDRVEGVHGPRRLAVVVAG
ncbi:MAG: L-lactate dehydrogenase complex protein LldG [Gaiellaceae bacterium]|nr:L-lactate dehydrogenase complex protein LldG [Gaiellaceae bacterium]